MTENEIRTEAARLFALDENGLEQEAIVRALRLGQQSEAASRKLQKLDLETFNALEERYYGGNGRGPHEGEE